MENHICASPNCTHTSHNRPMVNLHMHSSWSQLDGAAHIKDYIKLAKQYDHPAITITDHGNPAGLFDFYKACKKENIKPVLGLEFYLAQDITLRIPNKQRDLIEKDKHQTVLISNAEGYKNFCKLTYLSFTDGYYFKPRISYDMLFENSKGLIVTSGCAASMFNQLLNDNQEALAEEWFKKFVRIFADNFYGEIQFNELLDKAQFGMNQKAMNDFIIKMCDKYQVPIIIGGDTHYAYPEDNKLQDILIACQRRRDGVGSEATSLMDVEIADVKEEKKEFFIHARHLYYHQSSDYYKFNKEFGYNYDEKLITQALDNSVDILKKINFEFETGKVNFPKFPDAAAMGKTSDELLGEYAWKGLLEKLELRKSRGEVFTNEQIEAYEKQLDYELIVFEQKQISDYFLIVKDVIDFARNSNILPGIGRGCFSPEEVVRMSDNSLKKISEIQIGDKIIGRFGPDEVEYVWIYEIEEELIELTLENDETILCTLDHEILTINRGYVKAKDLTFTDNLQEAN